MIGTILFFLSKTSSGDATVLGGGRGRGGVSLAKDWGSGSQAKSSIAPTGQSTTPRQSRCVRIQDRTVTSWNSGQAIC